jgi:hypothetical protein
LVVPAASGIAAKFGIVELAPSTTAPVVAPVVESAGAEIGAVHASALARFSEIAPLELESVVPSGFTPPSVEDVAGGRT